MIELLPWVLASYLVGAIPTSYLTVLIVKGEDLRLLGSGNLGATNLYRVLGWRYAVPVALFDVLKGAVPVLLFAPRAGGGQLVALLLGAAAVIGHVFPVFLKFRGGKGVATAAGVMLGMAPWAFIVALITWALVVKASGYVSLASITAALVLPPAVYFLHPERRQLAPFLVGLAALIILLHRRNIRRLLSGTEHRFGQRAA
jgi:glycerol-3-phosphate acyltransferase PlsY